MADRPILFSGAMVKALLAGTKTQTRRILNLPTKGIYEHPQMGGWEASTVGGGGAFTIERDGTRTPAPERACVWHQTTGTTVVPRFAKGDRLWVKETWRDEHPIAIQHGRYSQPGRAGIPGPPGVSYQTIYRADGEPLQAWRRADGEHPYFTLDGPADEIAAKHPTVCSTFDRADGRGAFWNSARYMPRWASRLTLTVTDVRVQRLQDCSAEDAEAEGCPECSQCHGVGWINSGPDGGWQCTAKGCGDPYVEQYARLWDEINGAGAWAANPWIVALTFSVTKGNIDEVAEQGLRPSSDGAHHD